MQFVRSGLILYCTKYQECCDFYRDILKLPVMFAFEGSEPLCCFNLGTSYLMVEYSSDARPNINALRLHLHDLQPMADHLEQKMIPFQRKKFSWGEVIEVQDPEGNHISIRDEGAFNAQITNKMIA